MEDTGILHIEESLHVIVLRIVFLPLINRDLCSFSRGWDSHPISSAGNPTPDQLWLRGQLQYHPDQDVEVVDEFYGVAFGGPVASEHDGDIQIPQLSGFDEHYISSLSYFIRNRINLDATSDGNGIEIYRHALQIAMAYLRDH